MEHTDHGTGELPLGSETVAGLIGRITGGDSSALMSLYDGTNRLVFGLIIRILGDRTLAEEALLDFYTNIWKQSASYEPGISPWEWLTKLARDIAVARLHWSKRDKRRQEIPAGVADPAITVAPGQQKLARSSLQAIPAAQRELLESAYYGGLSCNEMAAQIGRPLGAVKTHLRLGLSRLSESLRPAPAGAMEAGTATGGHIEARKSD